MAHLKNLIVSQIEIKKMFNEHGGHLESDAVITVRVFREIGDL